MRADLHTDLTSSYIVMHIDYMHIQQSTLYDQTQSIRNLRSDSLLNDGGSGSIFLPRENMYIHRQAVNLPCIRP